MPRRLDLTGQKFGRLTVVEFYRSNQRCPVWRCRCDCGNEAYVSTEHLRSGTTKSCGCLHSKVLLERNYKHGGSKERLYGVWQNMISRCYKPNNSHFSRYGGRGIKICDEWRNDYAAFRKWAMANGYDPDAPFGECTIDRINNDAGYSPDNCRWTTLAEQMKNKTHGSNPYRDSTGRFASALPTDTPQTNTTNQRSKQKQTTPSQPKEVTA